MQFVPCIDPDPKFDMTMYTVPENNRTVELCIDIDVEITAPFTYTITTAQKSPPQAEGKKKHSNRILCTYTYIRVQYTDSVLYRGEVVVFPHLRFRWTQLRVDRRSAYMCICMH